MDRVDRIEKRRFVGREFLLFLWFESEVFDATLETAEHGSFGLWLERKLVLTCGKESTSVVAPSPGLGREAKEALFRGQLPKSAGIRIAFRGDETAFVLDAERLSVGGLKLQTVLDQETADESAPSLEELRAMMATRPPPRKGRKSRQAEADDETYEVFYERMRLTEEFEALLAALYRDFLALRLGPTFVEQVVPAMRNWAAGLDFDLTAYKSAREAALARAKSRPARDATESAAAPSA